MKGRGCRSGTRIRLLRNRRLDRTWHASLDYYVGFDSERSGVSPRLCGWSALLCSHLTKASSSSASRSLLSVLLSPLPEAPASTLLSGRRLLANAQSHHHGARRLEEDTRGNRCRFVREAEWKRGKRPGTRPPEMEGPVASWREPTRRRRVWGESV